MPAAISALPTTRAAIAAVRSDSVLFQWKDYRHEARLRTMTLTADEFIRRFLLHVLPVGFKRIRSYGWLANCHRAARLATCRRLLGVEPPAAASPAIKEDYRDRYQRLTGRSLLDCPVCARGHMVRIEGALPDDTPGILPRAPPDPGHGH